MFLVRIGPFYNRSIHCGVLVPVCIPGSSQNLTFISSRIIRAVRVDLKSSVESTSLRYIVHHIRHNTGAASAYCILASTGDSNATRCDLHIQGTMGDTHHQMRSCIAGICHVSHLANQPNTCRNGLVLWSRFVLRLSRVVLHYIDSPCDILKSLSNRSHLSNKRCACAFGIGSDYSSRDSHELYAQWFSLLRESLDGGLGMGPIDDPVWLISFFGCAASRP